MQKRMQDEMKRRQDAGRRMPEGHITVDPGATKQQRRNDDGDFVDYEEVK